MTLMVQSVYIMATIPHYKSLTPSPSNIVLFFTRLTIPEIGLILILLYAISIFV